MITLDYVCIGSLWINIVQLKHILWSTNIYEKKIHIVGNLMSRLKCEVCNTNMPIRDLFHVYLNRFEFHFFAVAYTRVVPVNRGLYKYIKNLMSQSNKTFHIYEILYYTHNK